MPATSCGRWRDAHGIGMDCGRRRRAATIDPTREHPATGHAWPECLRPGGSCGVHDRGRCTPLHGPGHSQDFPGRTLGARSCFTGLRADGVPGKRCFSRLGKSGRAQGANAPGCECPPAPACGRRLLLDFASRGIRTRVSVCTAVQTQRRGLGLPGGLRSGESGKLPKSREESKKGPARAGPFGCHAGVASVTAAAPAATRRC